MNGEPRWRTLGPRTHDHLLDERALGLTAWCGIDLSTAAEGGFRHRCGDCLRLVRRYYNKATAEPPQRVVEILKVTVVRNGNASPAIDVIPRKLAAMRSWDVTVEAMAPVAEVP